MIIVAGPCQVESVDHALTVARELSLISTRIGAPITFKASFDKANRTSHSSERGAGIAVASAAFRKIRNELDMRVLTDVHEPWHCEQLADYVDVLQIPALLCRQTDLIEAAARTGRDINIKKGQFMAGADMVHAVAKARMAGADVVLVTERGTTFGYRDLVVDMRNIAEMKRSGAEAVLFDCTHSVQSPGSLEGATGGNPAMSEVLARAAIAAGANGLFLECHDNPAAAPSDGAVMMPLNKVEAFLERMLELKATVDSL